MVDITELIGVDEHYTIVEELAPSSGKSQLLPPVLPLVGSTVILRGPPLTKILIKNRLVEVPRYIRDTNKKLIVNEAMPAQEKLVSALKNNLDKKALKSDEIISYSNIGSRKKVLGVQRAMVFTDAEQVATERVIQKQKKELRADLKQYVKVNESLRIEMKQSSLIFNQKIIKMKRQEEKLSSQLLFKDRTILEIKQRSSFYMREIARLKKELDMSISRMKIKRTPDIIASKGIAPLRIDEPFKTKANVALRSQIYTGMLQGKNIKEILVDIVPKKSKSALSTWLATRERIK